MIKHITDGLFNFFLHIEINTLNLPYTKLPRPRKANWVSKLARRVFEKKWLKKAVGVQLALAMLIVPNVIGSAGASVREPSLPELVTSELISSYENTAITTKPREFVLPVKRLRYISTNFSTGHPGLDLNSYVGDDVFAFSGGRVHTVEDTKWGFGRYIILDHGHNLFSLYAHLQTSDVAVGDVVEAGQKIGEVGMTGYTTGPHLHFEVHDNSQAIDPRVYLDLK